MKKAIPIKTKKITQNNEGLATGLLDFGRDVASASKSGSNYKQQKERFAADFKAQWKDWWNRRKDIDLTQDSEAQAEQDKRDNQNEKRREKRKTTSVIPQPTGMIQVPQNVGSGPRPVTESKRFLNKSIMSESEYNRLNYLFENIVHLDEVSDEDAHYKAIMMNNFLQQVYPTIWKESQSPRNKLTYESELMKWANSGFFSIGALDHFIELLYPLAQQGIQAEKSTTPADDRPTRDSYARFSKEEVEAAIKDANDNLDKLKADTGSLEYRQQYLILDALKNYKTR